MPWLYSIGIFGFWMALHLASLWNPKAKKWVSGRIFKPYRKQSRHTKRSIWFHCASLGEFEQARPLIEAIRKENPKERIILSFFSPSGYEIRKDYTAVDEVLYLPIDLPGPMKSFIKYVNPKFVVFVKYDFWFNCLNILTQKDIPYLIISGVFRKTQYFFLPGFAWFKRLLKNARQIFVQHSTSEDILLSRGFANITLSGDTRIDRVLSLKDNHEIPKKILQFKSDKKLWICGSIHPGDFKLLKSSILRWITHHKVLLAPHDLNAQFIVNMLESIPASIKFTSLNEKDLGKTKCLILDTVGMLSNLYPLADFVYIGGGFGKGIHNILEPAVFKKPIITGPNYRSFFEANWFAKRGGLISVKQTEDLEAAIQKCQSDEYQMTVDQNCDLFFQKHAKATDKTMQWLRSSGLLSQ